MDAVLLLRFHVGEVQCARESYANCRGPVSWFRALLAV